MKLTDIEAILGTAADVTRLALPNMTAGGTVMYDHDKPNRSGPPLALWACFADKNPTLEFPCAAIQDETTEEWFMLNACENHVHLVRDVPFSDLDEFLPPEYRDVIESPDMHKPSP